MGIGSFPRLVGLKKVKWNPKEILDFISSIGKTIRETLHGKDIDAEFGMTYLIK